MGDDYDRWLNREAVHVFAGVRLAAKTLPPFVTHSLSSGCWPTPHQPPRPPAQSPTRPTHPHATTAQDLPNPLAVVDGMPRGNAPPRSRTIR